MKTVGDKDIANTVEGTCKYCIWRSFVVPSRPVHFTDDSESLKENVYCLVEQRRQTCRELFQLRVCVSFLM